MKQLLAYEVTAQLSDDEYHTAIVFAHRKRHAYALGVVCLWHDIHYEPEYIDLIKMRRLKELDSYGQKYYGKEKVVKFESDELKGENPELLSQLRELGFYFNGYSEWECDGCGLYTMAGEYPLCQVCFHCQSCGHEEDCGLKEGQDQ